MRSNCYLQSFLPYNCCCHSTGRNRSQKNPQKLTQSSPRSHPRHLVGKGTARRDINNDITSDGQVNSFFPYRWSPASLTFNIYFYLFLYVYITRITVNNDIPHLFLYLYITRTTINNDTSHLNSPKNKNKTDKISIST